jgi:1-deoxy-D-xylulose-5-phosphate reductoisomerase
MNAANETVVDAFLNNKIGFLQMSDIIEETIEKIEFVKDLLYEDYVYFNDKARKIAGELITKK